MADRLEKLMQALDAERPARPESQYDIGYNNGLTMAMAIVRKFAKDINAPGKKPKSKPPQPAVSNITEETKAALNRMGAQAHGGEESE